MNPTGNGNWCKVTVMNNPVLDSLGIIGKTNSGRINPYNGPNNGPNNGLKNITYYRIISAGSNAFSNGLVSNKDSSAYNVSPGIYTYNPDNNSQYPVIANNIGNFNRSYNIMTINITTGLTSTASFDVWASKLNTESMTNYLNALNANYIIIIASLADPSVTEYDYLPDSFKNAMRRCGASKDFGNYNVCPITNSSYILVSIAGRGTGTGYERTSSWGGDNAITDLRISVVNGGFTVL